MSFVSFFLFVSSSLLFGASSSQKVAEFGVVKSKLGEAYLSCTDYQDLGKVCAVKVAYKGMDKPETVMSNIRLVPKELMMRDERFSSGAKKRLREGLPPVVYMPMIGTSLALTALGGPKYLALLLLSPLDLVAAPLGLVADGVYRLYKAIQNVYLKKAFKTIFGVRKSGKTSMTLSKKDFKDFVSLLHRTSHRAF